jgi:hypothetical protein
MSRVATWLVLAAAFVPSMALAQQDPVERLAEVLPESVRARVIARVEEARARQLPEQAMANLALEGVAKGRSAEEVLAAVELLVAEMGRAQEALQAAGRPPVQGDIEAATAAMRMGVEASAVSELARSGPSGRSLAVPLLVIGTLADRGLPSDDALAAVRERLEARADDAELLRAFPEVAQGLGMRPDQVGTAHASGKAGFQLPVSGVTVPVGPPAEPGPGAGRPPEGRGRPDGVPQGGGPPR